MKNWKVQIRDGYEKEVAKVLKNLTSEEETIIYKWINFVEKKRPIVEVIRITGNHDYS